MTPGQILVALALVSGLGTTVLLFADYLRDESRFVDVTAPLLGSTAALLTGALLYLTYQFVVTDYSNAYVWQNTADYLPVLYRVTGVYASNAGSILLWAALASLVAFVAAVVRGIDRRSMKLVQGITMAVVTYFAGMLVVDSPFTSITAEFPDAPAGFAPTSGQGLNPLLVDPYMAIHPPVMFISYALLTMPFAIGVAHFVSLIRGEDGLFSTWIGSVMRWLRVSWLCLTAAVALGALWSYTVLGWGGIWAWDPVETAIFVPWLFLTATLHAVTNYREGDTYTTLAPAMTAAVFALAIYTTSVVRSGVFRSVHSFANDGIGSALLVLMGATAFLGVVVPFGYWLLQPSDEDDRDGDREWLTRQNLLHLAVLGLGLLTFISMWGLSFPLIRDVATGIEVEVNAKYYNLWSYPIVLGLLLVLGFYMDFDVEGKRRSLVGLAIFGGATVAAAFVTPSEAWVLGGANPGDAFVYQLVGNASALSALPPVAYVFTTVIKRAAARVSGTEHRRFQLKETGIAFIHVGVALLIVSLAFTYLFTAQSSAVVRDVGPQVDPVEVPDSDYALQATGYRQTTLPRNPSVDTYASAPGKLIADGRSTNGSVRTIHGTVTNVIQGERATVVQLDNSDVWVGVTGENRTQLSVQPGQELVAKGLVMWDFVPQADVVVLADANSVGSPSNPPAAVDPTRVVVTSLKLNVYRGDELVTTGIAGQRRYVKQSGMQVRDVLIDRGLVYDTYVIAAVGDGSASMTVKRIPLMTAIRLSVALLLAGMLLVLLFDPAHGVWDRRLVTTRTDSPTDQPTTSD